MPSRGETLCVGFAKAQLVALGLLCGDSLGAPWLLLGYSLVALRLLGCSEVPLTLLSGCFQAFSASSQVVFRLITGCVQVVSSCFQVAVRLLSGCCRLAFSLLSACSQVALGVL